MFEHMGLHVSTYVRGEMWRGIKLLKLHLSEWLRPHSSFRILSFVKAVATNTLKEPLLLHQGGGRINEAMPEDRERKRSDKADK